MALLNNDTTPFLGYDHVVHRPISYTKDIHDFTQEDYWYAEFFNHDSIKYLLDPKVIPVDILDKIRGKTCYLMLNNAHEAFHSVVKPIYDIVVKQLGIPPEQIILISESAIIDKEVEKIANEYGLSKIKTEWMRLFEHDTGNIEHKQLKTLEYKNYTKKFVNFNRRWRLHRPTLVGLLKINGLLDHGFVSLARNVDGFNWDTFFDHVSHTLKYNQEFVDLFVTNRDTIESIPDLLLDQSDMTINHAAKLTDSTDYYYENSYFSIVTETNFFEELGEGIFASEKIFRPILKTHPFILLSRPKTLNILKSIGYQTFHPFIDESYDDEMDDCKRMLMIVDEIKRLSFLNDKELESFLNSVRPIVHHNYNTLRNKTEFLTKLW